MRIGNGFIKMTIIPYTYAAPVEALINLREIESISNKGGKISLSINNGSIFEILNEDFDKLCDMVLDCKP